MILQFARSQESRKMLEPKITEAANVYINNTVKKYKATFEQQQLLEKIVHQSEREILLKTITEDMTIENPYVDDIYNRVWKVLVNFTDIPFITSDNPYKLASTSGVKDINDKNAIHYFPMTPNILISTISPKWNGNGKVATDRTIIPIKEIASVHTLNAWQMVRCVWDLYSSVPLDKKHLFGDALSKR